MDLTDLRKLSAKNELSLNYIYKDLMISRALSTFRDDRLILKGGTAINRVYLRENARFSEDIDLDFVIAGNMQDLRNGTREIITRLQGFDIEKPRIMGKTLRYDAFFVNPLGVKDRIMIEFTMKKTAELKRMDEKFLNEAVNFCFVPAEAALIQVYSLQTLFRQKLDCLKTRREGKDIYDLFYLADICKVRPSKGEYEEIARKLDLTPKEIKNVANATNHYIKKSLRPDWPTFITQLREKLAIHTNKGIHH